MSSEDTRRVLARNLRALMDQRGWDQGTVAKHSGVSQKTVSNMLRMEGSPRVESVQRVAEAFEIQGWQLIAATIDTSLKHLLDAWVDASDEGRAHILRVAEREAEYQTRD